MNNKVRNAMVVGAVGAISYSMYRQTRNNSKKPMNMAKNMISKTANMF